MKKRLTLLTTILIILLMLMGTLLYLVFRPVDGEEEALYNELEQNYNLNKASALYTKTDFKKIREANEADRLEAAASKESAVADNPEITADIKFNESISDKAKELNSYAFAVAEEAMRQSSVDQIPSEIRDPLVILAQASTELGGVQDGKTLWAPAIPNKYITESLWTVDYMKSFSTADAVLSKGAFTTWKNNKSFAGPLQQSITYGIVDAQDHDDSQLFFKDEYSSISANSKALQIFNNQSAVPANKVRKASGSKKVGDRWNWHDASFLVAQKWDYDFGRMNDQRKAKVKNTYMLVAWAATNHNVGESVSVSADSKTISRGIYTNSSVKAIWDYMEWLSSKEVVEELDKIAKKKVDAYYANGTSPMGHLNSTQLKSIINAKGSTLPNKSAIYSNAGSEKIMHPAKMLEHYLVLKRLYSGE